MKIATTTIYLRALAVALLCLAVLVATAQVLNEDDLRKIELAGNTSTLVELECLPDGHTIWAIGAKGDRILVIDTISWNVVKTIPIDGFERGATMTASSDGRYILLKETPPYSDPNKQKDTHLAVLDAATGAVVLDIPSAMDGCLLPVGGAMATLDDEVVTVRSFSGGKRSFKVAGAACAIAIDPLGKFIAVGLRPTAPQLQQVPSMRNDKKAMKPALKYRQLIGIYTVEDGSVVRIVPAIYDLIQGMHFTADGEQLLVFSVPDTRSHMAPGGHVEQVQTETWEPLRASFMTWTSRPNMAVCPDGGTLALSSIEGKNKRKLTVYDRTTGDTRLMIDLEQKHRYDKAEGELHDARLGYAWLPDGRLLIAQGPSLGCYRP